MAYSIEEDTYSFLVRLDEWSKSSEIRSGETGRIIATVLALIIISYAILFLARLVSALTLPALVIMVFLVIYRCVSVADFAEGLKQVPYILHWLMNYIADFTRKARCCYSVYSCGCYIMRLLF